MQSRRREKAAEHLDDVLSIATSQRGASGRLESSTGLGGAGEGGHRAKAGLWSRKRKMFYLLKKKKGNSAKEAE